VYEYGQVRAQSGLYHGGFCLIFERHAEGASCLVDYGGELSMLRSKSSLKIPLVRLLLLFDSWGRIVNGKNRRFGRSSAAETATTLARKEREKEKESRW